MKKHIKLFITYLLIAVFFTACTYPLNHKKSNKYYYTNLLAKHMRIDENPNVTVIDTNFYKGIDISKENVNTLKNFISTLKPKNFISKPKDLPKKPEYKIFIKFSNAKYVINVYSEKYISLYPWDGNLPMDYIDMNGIYLNYNLYGMCKNVLPEN